MPNQPIKKHRPSSSKLSCLQFKGSLHADPTGQGRREQIHIWIYTTTPICEIGLFCRVKKQFCDTCGLYTTCEKGSVKHQHTDLKDTGNSTFLMFHHRTNSWVCHRNEMRWMVAKNQSKDTIREQVGLYGGRSQHLSLMMVVPNDEVYRFLKVQMFSKATRQQLPINFSKDCDIQHI